MLLLSPSEYSVESLMADLPLARSNRNKLEIQLIALQEGLAVSDNPLLRQRPLQIYTVSGFQTLPMVSTAVYGVPDRWMAIATTNNLDYPYTIIPGQVLTLPEA
jgi:hypothetical protein